MWWEPRTPGRSLGRSRRLSRPRPAQASSRSTSRRVAGVRRGTGTSAARPGTNEASRAQSAACSCSSTERMPWRASEAQLVADVGLEHLGAVGVDGVAHAVTPERVEDPAELVPAGHDARVEVAGRADLQRDAALADHGHRARVVGRLDAVTDAVGLELVDDLRDLVDRARFARVDGDAQAVLAAATEERAVVGRVEAVRLRARRCRRRRRHGRGRRWPSRR